MIHYLVETCEFSEEEHNWCRTVRDLYLYDFPPRALII